MVTLRATALSSSRPEVGPQPWLHNSRRRGEEEEEDGSGTPFPPPRSGKSLPSSSARNTSFKKQHYPRTARLIRSSGRLVAAALRIVAPVLGVALGFFLFLRIVLFPKQPPLVLADLLLLARSSSSSSSSSTISNMSANATFSTADEYAPWLGCGSDDCIQQIARRIARAFPPRHNKSSWCHSSSTARHNINHNPKYSGFILTKVPKGASSTCAGVALRIAHRHDCATVHWQHRWGRDYMVNKKDGGGYDPHRSFVWTTVRDPAQRALSTLFFHVVSRTPNRATASSDAYLLQQLSTNTHAHYGTVSPHVTGFQLRYTALLDHATEAFLATQPDAWNPATPEQVHHPALIVSLVQSVLQTYDFILVPERMDESLVALALTLQIDVGDVLVASSKVSTDQQYHLLHSGRNSQQCVPVVPSFTSPAVQDYFASPSWRALNYGDYLLHAAAHLSLDRTIAQYQTNNTFAKALQRYRTLRDLERQQCPTPDLPCSSDGTPQVERAARNCYLARFDFGCGYPCVDALLLLLQQQQQNNATTP